MTPTQEEAFRTWGARLFPFQRRWIAERSKFAVCVKARQIGFSHATAAGAVANALMRGRPQIVLSASQDLSDEVLAKCRAHASVLAALGYAGADRLIVDNATEIAWPNGGRVIALPANPRTARSFTGDVWLDEFAYHSDPEGIRDGAFPIATRGDWKVRVFSTPNGARGLFHGWVSATPTGWARHRVTVDDAIREGLPLDTALLGQLCGGDDRLYRQWYGCEFTDADQQYYPSAWLERAFGWSGEMPALDADGVTLHAGLDVGRTRDLTALVVVASLGRVAWVVAVLTCSRTKYAEQKAMIARARKRLHWDTLHVDAGGLGSQLAEELVDLYGEEEVIPVTFTPLVKEELATRAYRYLATDRLRLPRGAEGEHLRDEGKDVHRVVSKSGHVLYASKRSGDGHGDRWTALTLALKGAGEPTPLRVVGDSPLLAVA